MPITKNSGRQEQIVAFVDVLFSDLASGVAQAAIDMPVGAVLTGGGVTVDTAFNSATSDSLVVGDALVANRYKTTFSIAAAGRTPLVATGYKTLATSNRVFVTWTGVGTVPSAGAFTLEVHYYGRKRANFAQG